MDPLGQFLLRFLGVDSRKEKGNEMVTCAKLKSEKMSLTPIFGICQMNIPGPVGWPVLERGALGGIFIGHLRALVGSVDFWLQH